MDGRKKILLGAGLLAAVGAYLMWPKSASAAPAVTPPAPTPRTGPLVVTPSLNVAPASPLPGTVNVLSESGQSDVVGPGPGHTQVYTVGTDTTEDGGDGGDSNVQPMGTMGDRYRSMGGVSADDLSYLLGLRGARV